MVLNSGYHLGATATAWPSAEHRICRFKTASFCSFEVFDVIDSVS